MSTFSSESASEQFFKKIGRFTLLNRYLTPSLTKRLQGTDWYENRIIRYILRESPWVGNHFGVPEKLAKRRLPEFATDIEQNRWRSISEME